MVAVWWWCGGMSEEGDGDNGVTLTSSICFCRNCKSPSVVSSIMWSGGGRY